MKYFIAGAVIVGVAMLAAFSLAGTKTVEVTLPAGAAAGPEQYNKWYFYNGLYGDNFIQGGGTTTLSGSSMTTTISAADIRDNSALYYDPNAFSDMASTSWPNASDMTTSTSQFLRFDGDSKIIKFQYATTVAATSTIIFATTTEHPGIGTQLWGVDASVTDFLLVAGQWAELEFVRRTAEIVDIFFRNYLPQ